MTTGVARKREEARSLKRERILDVATDLFFRNGYNGASMGSISAELGVTKPFLYYHFENKEEILLALYQSSVDAALDVVTSARAAGSNPVEQLRFFAREYGILVARQQKRIALNSREKGLLPDERMAPVNRAKRAFHDALTDLLRDGLDAGLLHVPDPALTAHAITGMISWVFTWYSPGGRQSPAEIAAHMELMTLRMVGTTAPNDVNPAPEVT